MWLAKRYVMMWLATESSFIHSSFILRLGVCCVKYMVKGHFCCITLLHYEYNIPYSIIFFCLWQLRCKFPACLNIFRAVPRH